MKNPFYVRECIGSFRDADDVTRFLFADEGITFRDWMAVAALEGMLSNGRVENDVPRIAAAAYEIADAMLAERERTKPTP